jgi:hypothetical protein
MGIADQGHNSGVLTESLPGNVTSDSGYEYNNVVVNATHPIVSGKLSGTFNGNYASHRYVNDSSLPAGSNVIIRGSDSNQPTLVEYPLGNGSVIATGQTWEYSWVNGYSFAGVYDDLIKYAYDRSIITPPADDLLQQATKAVEKVEGLVSAGLGTQELLDGALNAWNEAQTKVSALPEGEGKTSLQNRLNKVKKQINKAQNILNRATTAEGYLQKIFDANLTSKSSVDAAIDNLNKAKGIYYELPDSDVKEDLGTMIDEAQDEIATAIMSLLSGQSYILTGKQMTVLIQESIQATEATSSKDVDRVMAHLMQIVEGHTNMSESVIRGLVQLYLPQSRPV